MTDITISTSGTLPAGYVGTPYRLPIAFSGNATPVTAAAVASGSLPAGLSVGQASTGAWSVYGVPTTAGTSTFEVSLTDAAGAFTSGSLSLTVNASDPAFASLPLDNQLARLWPDESF